MRRNQSEIRVEIEGVLWQRKQQMKLNRVSTQLSPNGDEEEVVLHQVLPLTRYNLRVWLKDHCHCQGKNLHLHERSGRAIVPWEVVAASGFLHLSPQLGLQSERYVGRREGAVATQYMQKDQLVEVLKEPTVNAYA